MFPSQLHVPSCSKSSLWFPLNHLIEWLLAFYKIFQNHFYQILTRSLDRLSHLAAGRQIPNFVVVLCSPHMHRWQRQTWSLIWLICYSSTMLCVYWFCCFCSFPLKGWRENILKVKRELAPWACLLSLDCWRRLQDSHVSNTHNPFTFWCSFYFSFT